MKELVTKVNDIEITYMQKPRKYDTKHLIVIFSGFGATGEFTYDFRNALGDCPAEVLWIKDDFNNHCSYYVSQDFKFEVEAAVIEFIENKLQELKLDKKHCTLAGASKGGAASLYYGFKYNFNNIVASVPQFYIGSYAKKNWPMVAENMMGEVTDDKVAYLDNFIPNAMKNDENKDKNIYVMTSPADRQYPTEIVPNIPNLEEYSNFNLLVSNSVVVREHGQVTPHHLTVVLSILYSLSVGIAPKYSKRSEFITDQALLQGTPTDEHLVGLQKFKIDQDGIMFIDGYSVIRGRNCGGWDDIRTELVLENSKGERRSIDLARGQRASLTRMLFRDYLVVYDKGWFTTLGYNGIDIKGLPKDKYKLLIKTTCEGITKITALDSRGADKVISDFGGYEIINKQGSLFLFVNRSTCVKLFSWKSLKKHLRPGYRRIRTWISRSR